MFYQTYGFGAGDSICHAVFDDGINFEKNAGNPIFSPTKDWCCGRAIDADVCIFNNKLFLYTATRDHAYAVQKIAAACAPLTDSGYGFGDFKQICACSVLFPEMKWEQNCIEAPATIVDNGKIYMFYGGAYNCSPRQIGCAASSDGRTFDKLFCEKPFIANGKEGGTLTQANRDILLFFAAQTEKFGFIIRAVLMEGKTGICHAWKLLLIQTAFLISFGKNGRRAKQRQKAKL